MIHAKPNKKKEATCCGYCTLKCSAIALIVLHIIVGIISCCVSSPLGILDILCAICGITALVFKKKCLAIASAVFVLLTLIGPFIFVFLIYQDYDGDYVGTLPTWIFMAIICMFWLILKVCWGCVWIKIGNHFEQEKQSELVTSPSRKRAKTVHKKKRDKKYSVSKPVVAELKPASEPTNSDTSPAAAEDCLDPSEIVLNFASVPYEGLSELVVAELKSPSPSEPTHSDTIPAAEDCSDPPEIVLDFDSVPHKGLSKHELKSADEPINSDFSDPPEIISDVLDTNEMNSVRFKAQHKSLIALLDSNQTHSSPSIEGAKFNKTEKGILHSMKKFEKHLSAELAMLRSQHSFVSEDLEVTDDESKLLDARELADDLFKSGNDYADHCALKMNVPLRHLSSEDETAIQDKISA